MTGPAPAVSVHDVPSDALLLDVREDEEWAAGHIAGALHVPMFDLPDRLAVDPGTLTADAEIYVVCRIGARSAQVASWLAAQGFDARNVEGGMLAWRRAQLPMVAESGTAAQVI